jgi:hypothetical protein
MEKMAAMHPHFLRLPGGNYLEGDHIADRFHWKKTIGPWWTGRGIQPVELPVFTTGWGCWSFWSGART